MKENKSKKYLMSLHSELHRQWRKEKTDEIYWSHNKIAEAMEQMHMVHASPLEFESNGEGEIIFHGTRGLVEETSDSHKYHTCIEYRDNHPFIIDVGASRIEKDKLPDVPIIITHSHPDHLYGLRDLDLANRRIAVSELFINSKGWLEEKKNGYVGFTPQIFKGKGSFVFANRLFHSVPVLHSLIAPNVALIFEFAGKKICHVTDILSMRESDREKYLKGVDIYIGDGSSLERTLIHFKKKKGERGKPFGHISVKEQLKFLRKANVPYAIFTHWGSEPIKMG
ncbi:MAG: MBL fold metallo-hydrolase, partial [Candidatus Njordarchaeales archaeon]